MACCLSNFYSTEYPAPNCNVECLDSATPGAVFVGSTGDIFILVGEDPCNLAHWIAQGNCCINFTNLSDTLSICCNQDVVLTSEDNSISITVTEDGIDFSTAIEMTFEDDYAHTLTLVNGSNIDFHDQNGLVVEIGANQITFSGNSYAGAGVPVLVPTHNMLNFYLNSTTSVLYTWNPATTSWVRVANKTTVHDANPSTIPGSPVILGTPANPINGDLHIVQYADGHALWTYSSGWSLTAKFVLPKSLPVVNFSYITSGLAASFDGRASTSTQVGVSLTYQWTGTGPSTVVFSAATSAQTNATVSAVGEYTITLTITDSNGNSDSHVEIVFIDAKDRCENKFEIPDIAFADPDNPLDSEVNTWITANGPFNNNTILYLIGDGSVTSPDFIWIYTCE